jgi:hypothetical protein
LEDIVSAESIRATAGEKESSEVVLPGDFGKPSVFVESTLEDNFRICISRDSNFCSRCATSDVFSQWKHS